MKKILIWNNFPLRNIGGQAGYCYNIHEYLKEHPCEEITFLSDLIASTTKEKCEFEYTPIPSQPKKTPSKIQAIFRYMPRYVKFWYPITESIRFLKGLKFDVKVIMDDFRNDFYKGINEIPQSIDLNEFDFIHFHWVQTLMQFKYSYPDYKGKLILTSHCPCPWTDERITFHKPIAKFFRKIGIESECNGYRNADYIMFPCKEAREPYEKDETIRNTFQEIDNKFFYVPTAILDIDIDKDKVQKLSEFGVPQEAFVITFFGRHISIKGYDILKKIGAEILKRHNNVYIVCAGNGDIAPLKHPRWIELGFISNAVELHHQSDLYILPNRETYFDIGTLEVLRGGVHILMSETGGNRFFKGLPASETVGLNYFNNNDIDTAVSIIDSLIQKKEQNDSIYKQEGQSNRDLFLKYFTPDKFVSSYIDHISRLNS